MMGRALLIIGALATLGFLASAVLGYLLKGPADSELPRHVLVGLAACLAQLFSHCRRLRQRRNSISKARQASPAKAVSVN